MEFNKQFIEYSNRDKHTQVITSRRSTILTNKSLHVPHWGHLI